MATFTKDPSSGHGGKRDGAGRPPKNKSAVGSAPDTLQGLADSGPADFKTMLNTTIAAVEGLPPLFRFWTKPITENLYELALGVKRFEFELGENLRHMLDQHQAMEGQLEGQSSLIDTLLGEQQKASERAGRNAAALKVQIAELETELGRSTQALADLKAAEEATHAHLERIRGTVRVVEAAVPKEAIAAAIHEAFVHQQQRQLTALTSSPPQSVAPKPLSLRPKAPTAQVHRLVPTAAA